jgi:hypothetical protein
VVVKIIDKNCVFKLKSEGDPPISIYLNGPEASKVALQSVKMPSRLIHILSTPGEVQCLEKDPYFGGVIGLNPGFASRQEELLDPRVPEAPDHL